jgi:hypothetical protein
MDLPALTSIVNFAHKIRNFQKFPEMEHWGSAKQGNTGGGGNAGFNVGMGVLREPVGGRAMVVDSWAEGREGSYNEQYEQD